MVYEWKWAEETWWFLAVAIVPVLLDAAVTFDPTAIGDWQTWAISIGAACVRAVGAAGIAAIARARSHDNGVTKQ